MLESVFGKYAGVLCDSDFQAMLAANLLAPIGVTLLSPILNALTGPFAVSSVGTRRSGRREIDDKSHVFTFDPAGGVLGDAYAATGRVMQLAYGVLEREYREDLSNDEATAIGACAVQSAGKRATGSGNEVFLAGVTGVGVDIHDHTDFSKVL